MHQRNFEKVRLVVRTKTLRFPQANGTAATTQLAQWTLSRADQASQNIPIGTTKHPIMDTYSLFSGAVTVLPEAKASRYTGW